MEEIGGDPCNFSFVFYVTTLMQFIIDNGAFRSSIQDMKRVIGTIWILAFVAGTLPLLGWNRYIYEVT